MHTVMVDAKVLDILTRRQRDVMLARLDPAGGVVPQKTVAKLLGITQGAVSQRLSRGVARLLAVRGNVDTLLDLLQLGGPTPTHQPTG